MASFVHDAPVNMSGARCGNPCRFPAGGNPCRAARRGAHAGTWQGGQSREGRLLDPLAGCGRRRWGRVDAWHSQDFQGHDWSGEGALAAGTHFFPRKSKLLEALSEMTLSLYGYLSTFGFRWLCAARFCAVDCFLCSLKRQDVHLPTKKCCSACKNAHIVSRFRKTRNASQANSCREELKSPCPHASSGHLGLC